MESRPAPPSSLPLLRFLPPDVRKLVEDNFVPVRFPFGAPIVREGDDADAFYVITSGRARVVKMGDHGEEVSLHVLRPGDSFGEMALLQQGKRTVTVRASSEVETLKLDEAIFRAIVRSHPELASHFEAQAERRAIHNFLRVETAFADLPAEALDALIDHLERVTVEAGTLVVREGAPLGPMFIVEEGRLRTFVTQPSRRKYVAYLRRGDFFGERSMIRGMPRAASVEAVSPCRLLRLDPDAYLRLAAKYADLRLLLEDRAHAPAEPSRVRVPLDFQKTCPPASRRPTRSAPIRSTTNPRRKPPRGPSPHPAAISSSGASASAKSRSSARSTKWIAAPLASR